MKEDKWFWLVFISLIIAFIWFGIRPAYIKSSCQNKAREAGVEWWGLEFTQTLASLEKSQLQTEYVKEFYNRCLHDKGM